MLATIPLTDECAGVPVDDGHTANSYRRCWAALRKPLEEQGRVTMLSTCSRIGYRRRRGPSGRN